MVCPPHQDHLLFYETYFGIPASFRKWTEPSQHFAELRTLSRNSREKWISSTAGEHQPISDLLKVLQPGTHNECTDAHSTLCITLQSRLLAKLRKANSTPRLAADPALVNGFSSDQRIRKQCPALAGISSSSVIVCAFGPVLTCPDISDGCWTVSYTHLTLPTKA